MPNLFHERQQTVTDEPFVLSPDVLGSPLATVRRRAAAMAFDMVVLALVGTPLLVLVAIGAMYLQAPAMARTMLALSRFEQPEDASRALAETLFLALRRRPAAVPERYVEPLVAGDIEEVARVLEDDPVNLDADLGSNEPSYYDPIDNRIYLRRDILFGPLAGYFGYAAIALIYFTLISWVWRGRTPGKWLFGVRFVRLDGAPLRLWDCFGRAGGYAASLSTVGLGFFEAMWDPNRQTLHDRVAGTVVLREQSRSRRARRAEETDGTG